MPALSKPAASAAAAAAAPDDEPSEPLQCRVCLSEDTESNLVAPCNCAGSQRHIHLDCLRKWQRSVEGEIRARRCNVCDSDFKIRPPRPGLARGFGLFPDGLGRRGFIELSILVIGAATILQYVTSNGVRGSWFLAAGTMAWLGGILWVLGGLVFLLLVLPRMLGMALIVRDGRLALIASVGQPVPGLTAGCILVSTEHIPRGAFARSVVLLLSHGPEGSVGLIVNKPSLHQPEVAVAGALPPPLAHIGGPVSPDARTWLYNTEVHGSTRVVGGIFAAHDGGRHPISTLDDTALNASAAEAEGAGGGIAGAPTQAQTRAETAEAGRRPLICHAFSGCAGWAPRQLDGEVRGGAWVFLNATASFVFPPTVLRQGGGEDADASDDAAARGEGSSARARDGESLHARLLALARGG
jgi:putative AlgH/UPF0301 family transcriptional regulator